MLCVFLLLYAIHRPQSRTLFNVVCCPGVRYSLTPSNRENWGGLSQSSEIYCFSSATTFPISGHLQYFLEGKLWSYRFSTTLLWRRLAISWLGFNTIALFSCQIFKIDDASVNTSLIFWYCFAEMICSVPWNSPMGDYQNIWLMGEHSEPIGTIHTLVYGPTQKSPPSMQAAFKVASAPISSRLLCSRPSLLLSAPNQNRHAMLANLFHNKHTVNSLNNLTLYTWHNSFLKPCE